MTHDPYSSGDPLADRRADYAEAYAKAGDILAAADIMEQALERAPDWTLGRMRLAALFEEAGETEKARLILEAVLAENDSDPFGAALRLAALGLAPVPDASPPAFVAGLFDQYASEFETSLVEKLDYVVPDVLARMIGKVAGQDVRFGRALDLGCGTGLMGERLRPLVARLEGVDLSAGMLEKAERKGIYDRLQQGDILKVPELGQTPFDLVTAADVLIYLGDLQPIVSRVASLLAPNGLFALSVETNDECEAAALRPSLRYAHAPTYLERLAVSAGFAIRARRTGPIRKDRGQDVDGLMLVLQRTNIGK